MVDSIEKAVKTVEDAVAEKAGVRTTTVSEELVRAFELLHKCQREVGLSLRQEIEGFLKGRNRP